MPKCDNLDEQCSPPYCSSCKIAAHDVQPRAPIGHEERSSGIYESEVVPSGGMKFDGGKLRAGIAERTIPHLMQMIDRVLDYGAQKYDEGSWQTVPNAEPRYHDAANRHRIKVNLAKLAGISPENFFDEETGLPHRVGVIINEIFQLGLEVAEYDSRALDNDSLTVEQVYHAYAPVRAAAIAKAQALKVKR